MKEENAHQIDIELNEEVADGTYANLAIITHSHSEFIIDFIRMMPGVPKAKVKSRVILTPSHAKRLLMALKDNIDKFEDNFGEVVNTDDSFPSFPPGFNGPVGQA